MAEESITLSENTDKAVIRCCTKCGEEKPLGDFSRNKARKDGLSAACKACEQSKNKANYAKFAEKRRAYAKKYAEEHPEQRAAYAQQYHQENKEELNAYSKEYRTTHVIVRSDESRKKSRDQMRERYENDPVYRERIKQASCTYRKANPEITKAAQIRWINANRDRVRALGKKYRDSLPEEVRKERAKASRVRHRAARQAAQAKYNAARYDVQPSAITNEHLFMLHKWQDHCCFYCREPLYERETIEHVVALSRGGTNSPHNVVLSCAPCNFSKQVKLYGIEWLPEHVCDAPRIFSIYGTLHLEKLLNTAGILYERHLDHVQIQDRHVFVLSSFWLGWKDESHIKALAAQYPRAILLFDKELAARPQALINVLKAKAGIAERVGARKLEIAEPSIEEAREFVGTWHALGFTNGTFYIGLRDAYRWWAIAVIRQEETQYEVVRMTFCDTVAGGVSRIIAHFKKIMPGKLPIVAFTDQRIGDGASHFPAGFSAAGETQRTFFYATPEATGFRPRRAFQKSALAACADYFDETKTQKQIARANGLMRVMGLPLKRFILAP